MHRLASGDLIYFTSGAFKGEYASVVREIYTHRHMNHEDYEMASHGMGDLAGTYCSAFDVIFTDTGSRRRILCGKNQFNIIRNEKQGEAC